ncbi:MAG: MBL fold metallo-hydrolase [Abditibacteriota bacterium]|nr:MBL fold metallo-hydrolase [Abditibacteriota bacterium]
MLDITTILTGPFSTNTYILWNGDTKEAALVDPCADVGFVTGRIKEAGLSVKAILLTHGHFDHNFAAGTFAKKLKAPVYMDEKDLELIPIYLEEAINFGFDRSEYAEYDGYTFLSDGDTLPLLGEDIRVLEAPGHTKGSLVYIASAGALCGDVIFRESIGRYDLWGGSEEELMNSIKNKILTLPDSTVLYPGHGSRTTVGYERANNPYLLFMS